VRTLTGGVILASLLAAAAPAAAGPRLDMVTSPCPGPGCKAELVEPQAQGLRIVYLVFDGITLTRDSFDDDARTNTSAIVNSSTEVIPAFNINDLASTGGLTRNQIINKVVDDLYKLHQPYNVEFVTTRPSSGYYSMIVFGGSCQSVTGSSGCAGIALRDCSDTMPANITFAFPPGLRVADLATTAAQEAAHAFGLGHTSDQGDVMYPQILAQIPDGFGAGNIPDGSGCPQSATYQDSHMKMLQIIGARGQDDFGPSVSITAPLDGATIGGGTVLTADIDDNIAIDRATLFIDGAEQTTLQDQPWRWGLPLLDAGQHTLTVRAWDLSGNDGMDSAQVTVNPSTPQCDGPEDCESWEDCVGGQCQDNASGELGSPCDAAQECLSGLCAVSGDERRCTQLCDDATPCPDGFDCASGACWPAEGGGGGGCAAGSRGGAGAAGWLLLLALVYFRKRL
jgi:hypothetical protein